MLSIGTIATAYNRREISMIIQFQKHIDGRSTMRCLRDNGSSTYQTESEYFVKHDLLHVSVESVLNTKNAFFGLIAQGWDIDWFEIPAPGETEKRSISAEALFVEQLVGLVQLSWYREISLSELSEMITLSEWNLDKLDCLSDNVIFQIDTTCRKLLEEWEHLTPGSTMEIFFGPNGFELPGSAIASITKQE